MEILERNMFCLRSLNLGFSQKSWIPTTVENAILWEVTFLIEGAVRRAQNKVNSDESPDQGKQVFLNMPLKPLTNV